MKRGRQLRDCHEEDISQIRIAPDKTKKEREQDAMLKEKLQDKRRQGGQWKIQRGKIVRVGEGTGGD